MYDFQRSWSSENIPKCYCYCLHPTCHPDELLITWFHPSSVIFQNSPFLSLQFASLDVRRNIAVVSYFSVIPVLLFFALCATSATLSGLLKQFPSTGRASWESNRSLTLIKNTVLTCMCVLAVIAVHLCVLQEVSLGLCGHSYQSTGKILPQRIHSSEDGEQNDGKMWGKSDESMMIATKLIVSLAWYWLPSATITSFITCCRELLIRLSVSWPIPLYSLFSFTTGHLYHYLVLLLVL